MDGATVATGAEVTTCVMVGEGDVRSVFLQVIIAVYVPVTVEVRVRLPLVGPFERSPEPPGPL